MAGLEDAVLGLAATTYDTAWQQVQLRGELGDIAEAAAGSDAPLGLADVRALLDGTLAGRPTRASFRTGTLTVCTLVPMRSVPHRVVCLLGLDDGVFPRQSIRDGDDVLARDPWVGERDPRSEDRQLLLDAICAAGDHLVITYTGADERTGAPVPPGRAARRAARRARPYGDRARRRARPRRRHDPPPAAAVRRAQLRARRAAAPTDRSASTRSATPVRAPRPARARAAAPFLAEPAPPQPPADVELADLHRLLAHPARGFLRQRLQVAETRSEDEPADALPVELDASSCGASASGCSTSGSPASTPPSASPWSSAAAPCRPARSASRACSRSAREVEHAAARLGPGTRARAGVLRRRRRARRRHPAHRHRRRRTRRRAAVA